MLCYAFVFVLTLSFILWMWPLPKAFTSQSGSKYRRHPDENKEFNLGSALRLAGTIRPQRFGFLTISKRRQSNQPNQKISPKNNNRQGGPIQIEMRAHSHLYIYHRSDNQKSGLITQARYLPSSKQQVQQDRTCLRDNRATRQDRPNHPADKETPHCRKTHNVHKHRFPQSTDTP